MQADSVRFNATMFQFHARYFYLQTKRGGILTDKYEVGISLEVH